MSFFDIDTFPLVYYPYGYEPAPASANGAAAPNEKGQKAVAHRTPQLRMAMDVHEDDKSVTIAADLPGFAKEVCFFVWQV